MKNIQGEIYLSTGDVAEKLAVSRSTVLRWSDDWIANNGRFPVEVKVFINPVNRYRYFRDKDIRKLKKHLFSS